MSIAAAKCRKSAIRAGVDPERDLLASARSALRAVYDAYTLDDVIVSHVPRMLDARAGRRESMRGRLGASVVVALTLAACEPYIVADEAGVGSADGSRTDGGTALDAAGNVDGGTDGRDAEVDPPAHVILLGGAGAEVARGIEVDPGGRMFVAGNFTGELAVGAFTATSAGRTNTFVGALDPGGSPVWLEVVSSDGRAETSAVALVGSGDVATIGFGSARIDFGGGSHVPTGTAQDALVIVRDREGALRWWHAYDGDGNAQGQDVAWDPSTSRLVTAGLYLSTTIDADFAGMSLPRIDDDDGFVVSASGAGVVQWAMQLRSDGSANAAAIDARGGLVCVAGRFEGTFGVGAATGSDLIGIGRGDGFVLGMAADGSAAWSRAIGGTADDWMAAVAVVEDGDCVVLGRIDATTDPYRTGRVILARYSASRSDAVWSTVYDGDLSQSASALLHDAGGSIYVAGAFGQASWRPSPALPAVTSAGARDGFVARHDAAGAMTWIRAFGSEGNDSVEGLSLDPAGNIVAVATLAGDAVVGGAPIRVRGASDVAVISFAP
jgi:hypothetical protein